MTDTSLHPGRRARVVGLGMRRVAAWLIDWACILGWVAVVAAVGIPLYLAGVIGSVGLLASNVVGAALVVLPVTLGAAWLESRPAGATPGKRAMGIRVRGGSGSPGLGAAIVRNATKIALPWIIGHAAVYALFSSSQSSGSTPAGVIVLTVAAYVVPLVWVVCLFVGSGLAPYDRIAGTSVVRGAGPRSRPRLKRRMPQTA